MMVLLATLIGAGVGAGLVIGYRALRPEPPRLAAVLSDLERPGRSLADLRLIEGAGRAPINERLGRATLGFLDGTALFDTGQLRRRLRTLDKAPERHAFHKLMGAVVGGGVPLMLAAFVMAIGMTVSPGWVAFASVGLAVVGFFYPDLGLADRVESHRRAFRHALSAYLDLVTIILAGGGGLETALHAAAEAGDGWAFVEIRRALHRARLSGQTPWEGFDRLGQELGVEELRELAASAHLAGDHGARIRASLSAKADSIRAHQTATVEAQAEAATEKMLLPVVGLVVGMILFIGYGVVEAISTPTLISVP